LLAIIFWIPFFFKRPFLSVLHSLFFFFLLLRDIFSQLLFHDQDVLTLRNEMKVYTDSLLLNLFALIIISMVYLPIILIKNKRKISS
jgi:cellobiose-specific phosphotransferase system component IIC